MKSLVDYLWRILLAIFLLTVLQVVFGFTFGTEDGSAGLGWTLLSNSLAVLVLAYAVARSDAYGIKLAAAVFLVFFGIYVLNSQIEAIFFQFQISRGEAMRMMLEGFMVTLLFSPAIVFLLGKMQRSDTDAESPILPRHSITGYVWRFIVCDISYVFLYFIAGAITFPYVKDFYAEAVQLPAPDKILIMQFFRGLIYVIVTLPLIRMVGGKRLERALLGGLLLSILGGVAPLLLPNPYLPSHIRLIHGIEIGISNFIYGAVIGSLFGARLREQPAVRD